MSPVNPRGWKQKALACADLPPANRRALEKVVAWEAVKYAVKSGKLHKPTECSRCWREFPKTRIHAHHDDYTKPLDVKWYCGPCHATVHAIRNMPEWRDR